MHKVMKFIPCIAFIVSGCASEEVAEPVYVPQVNNYTQLDLTNPEWFVLDGFQPGMVVMQEFRPSKTNDGYERIQVLVRNVTTSTQRIRYRFDWQDKNGVVVMDPDNDGWEKTTLIPGDNWTLTSIAPRKDCREFRLRMGLIQ